MTRTSPTRNLRLVIEYDGTDYSGWQIQAKKKTVQGELVRAITEITGHAPTLHGAGRTDAGVHAEGQVANFHTSCRLPVAKWPNALNAHLPEDIAVQSAEEVPPDFHSQFHARGKIYRYLILQQRVRSALYRGAAHLVRIPLRIEAMKEAAALLVGRNDFRSFTTEAGRKKNTERTLRRLSIEERPPFLVLTFEGDGFLYNMVRSIVGTLLEVGYGNQEPLWVREVLRARDRKRAGPNMPAKGLTLVRVLYDPIPPTP